MIVKVIFQSALIIGVHLSPQYDDYHGQSLNLTISVTLILLDHGKEPNSEQVLVWSRMDMLPLVELASTNFPVPVNASSNCHHNFSFKSKISGVFSSPNFPNNYPDDSMCTYFFHAAPNGRVHISFDFFKLEKRTNRRCTFDYIEIYDISKDGYKKSVDRYCGSSFPKEFVSLLNKMEIVFKSDFTKQSNGFLGHYYFLGDNWQPFGPSTVGCGPGFLTGHGGIIQSPNFPGKYPPSTKCTWIIKVKETQKVLLTLSDLDLSSSSNSECKDTVLMVYYDFAILSSFPEEKYCGTLDSLTNHRKELLSISSRLVLRFETSDLVTSRSTGFKLIWTAVDLVDDGHCDGFLCNGGSDCPHNDPKCKEPVTKYCIHSSLKCNDLPNCGAVDKSDEEKCISKMLWIILYATIPTVLIILIGGFVFYCYCRHKRKQLHVIRNEAKLAEQTHWVSPHIRSLDYSPVPASSSAMHTTSFISSKHSSETDLKDGKKATDVRFNGSTNKKDIPSHTIINDALIKHKVVPCSDKEEITHVQLETVENIAKNFKTHQKRSSYHLMQELNIDDGNPLASHILS